MRSIKVRKLSGTTRGHGRKEGMDNLAFTEIINPQRGHSPYLGHDDPYKGKRKLSKMETQAKFEDLRKRYG